MTKKKGLGRGLEALLGAGTTSDFSNSAVQQVRLADLSPGRYQPRKDMDPEALQELADSIRAQGVIQPIVVRPLPAGSKTPYEIIAGERRFRASGLAGLDQVPVVVREVDDQAALAMALIENLQRQDLSALEEAEGIQRLIQEFGLTHEAAAQAVGRSRSATTNLLRLLSLPAQLQAHLRAGQIDAGHAKVLLKLPGAQQILLAEETIQKQLSVRELEDRIKQVMAEGDPGQTRPGGRSGQGAAQSAHAADWARMQEAISDAIGLVSKLKPKGKGGELLIQFNDLEEFEGLRQRLLPGSDAPTF